MSAMSDNIDDSSEGNIRTSITMSPILMEKIDESSGLYSSRSAFIRQACREKISRNESDAESLS